LPLKRGEKEGVITGFAELLRSAQAVLVTDYRGLNVAQMRVLRTKLRDHGSEVHIVKNTLAALAFERAGLDVPTEMLQGPSGFVIVGDDLSGPAKTVLDVASVTGFLTIKGGLMGGHVLDAAGVVALSKLPSRSELLSSFLGVLQAPKRQFVTVLNAPLVDFVGVLRAYSEKEQEAA